jgi:hypothetical protein
MRSISNSTSTKLIPSNNSMSANLLNNYQTSAFNNQSTINDWECNRLLLIFLFNLKSLFFIIHFFVLIALRKQARQLENEIDSKLVSFSKLCSNFTASSYATSNSLSRASSVAGSPNGPNSSSSDLIFMTLSNEIEEALKKLTALNGKMSDSLNSENVINSSSTIHTLQVIV